MSLALGAMAAQTVLGIGQTIAGMVRKKPIIPEADIPDEVFANLSDAEYWSMIGMPPAQRQRAIEDIQRTGATERAGIQSLKGGLGAVARSAQTEVEGQRGVADMDTSYRYKNIDRLERARGRMSEEKNRADDINRQIKLDERARRDEMIGAGMQNVMGALGTAAYLDVLGDDDEIGGKLFGGRGLFGKKTGAGVQPKAGKGGGGFDFGGSRTTLTTPKDYIYNP
jgi:hypothetical protein